MKGGSFIIFFTTVLLFVVQKADAQENAVIAMDEWQTGTITVRQDPRVQDVVNRQIHQNKRKKGIDGYRIQLLFNSGPTAREQADRTKADFLSAFPDYPVYVLYQSPFFKVRIGDFRTKREALKVYHQILKKYPTAYIVKDIVRFPDID